MPTDFVLQENTEDKRHKLQELSSLLEVFLQSDKFLLDRPVETLLVVSHIGKFEAHDYHE